jgi:hypothetical protein
MVEISAMAKQIAVLGPPVVAAFPGVSDLAFPTSFQNDPKCTKKGSSKLPWGKNRFFRRSPSDQHSQRETLKFASSSWRVRPGIGKDFFHGRGVEDAFGPKIELFRRGCAQTLLKANVQDTDPETFA